MTIKDYPSISSIDSSDKLIIETISGTKTATVEILKKELGGLDPDILDSITSSSDSDEIIVINNDGVKILTIENFKLNLKNTFANKKVYRDNAIRISDSDDSTNEIPNYSVLISTGSSVIDTPNKSNSVILGGFDNQIIEHSNATSAPIAIIGGYDNTFTQNNEANNTSTYKYYGSMLGGMHNRLNAASSSIIGGSTNTINIGYSAIIEGSTNTINKAFSSVITGSHNTINATNSTCVGSTYSKINSTYELVTGHCNEVNTTYCLAIGTTCNDVSSEKNRFIIGNGVVPGDPLTATWNRKNCFRVTSAGAVYALTDYNSSGADYAEFIKEWADGNPENEDRVGYFVTIRNGLLYKANTGDYIVGITSGNPSVIGNSDEDYYWRFERDIFNRLIYEDVYDYLPETDEKTGETIFVKSKDARKVPKEVKNYNPELQKKYIHRKDRKEWDYVGMVGVIPVRDDGTCLPDHFCKCGNAGIATFASERGFDTYYVIERLADNVVSVIVK